MYEGFVTFQIRHQTQQEDDDLEVVEDVVIDTKKKIICPITRSPFVNPVKKSNSSLILMNSSSCNHTYSKEAILSMLSGRGSVKCPVAGCSKTVSERTLTVDEDMIWLLVSAIHSNHN